MAWTPISGTPPQFQKSDGTLASGYYLKFYQDGTSTAFSMATDNTGGTTLAKCEINSAGYPVNGSSAVFIPYVDQKYKIALYKNSTDADADTIANADWNVDIVPQVQTIDASNERVFETVAAMVAATDLNIGDHIRTLGYDAIGDGGGNEYDVVAAATGTDDEGLFIDLNTHQAKGLFPGGEYNVMQWGGHGDSAAFQKAVTAAANNTLIIPPKSTSYVLSGVISTVSPITIIAHGATLEWTTNSTDQGFKSTSSNVHIIGGTWKGPGFAAYTQTQIGIWFEGTNPSTYLTNISVKDTTIHNWGGTCIRFRMCQFYEATGNYLYDSREYGVVSFSCLDGVIHANRIDNLDGNSSSEAWGIGMTKNTGAVSTWPLTQRVAVTGNIVSNIELWEGIDTHGGCDLSISGNEIYDCKLGIVVTRFDDGTNEYGPKRITVSGNVIRNENVSKTDVGNGIQIVGASATALADMINVTGNTVTNHGKDIGSLGGGNFSAGIYMNWFGTVTLSNNTVEDGGTHGLMCENMVGPLNGTTNTFKDLTDATTGSAIYFDGDGSAADGCLENTVIDVSGYIGVYCQTQTDIDMINTRFINATTNWSQNGGSSACQYLSRVDPVHVGTYTGWTPTILNGGTHTETVTSIPGCSSECVVGDIGFNRDLEGLHIHYVTGDTDTTQGDFDMIAYNYTGAAVTVAGALTIPYKIIKPS